MPYMKPKEPGYAQMRAMQGNEDRRELDRQFEQEAKERVVVQTKEGESALPTAEEAREMSRAARLNYRVPPAIASAIINATREGDVTAVTIPVGEDWKISMLLEILRSKSYGYEVKYTQPDQRDLPSRGTLYISWAPKEAHPWKDER